MSVIDYRKTQASNLIYIEHRFDMSQADTDYLECAKKKNTLFVDIPYDNKLNKHLTIVCLTMNFTK